MDRVLKTEISQRSRTIIIQAQPCRKPRPRSNRTAFSRHVIVGCQNPQKIGSFETGSADERPINIDDRHQVAGVLRLDLPAIQDAHGAAVAAEAGLERRADGAMNLGHIL